MDMQTPGWETYTPCLYVSTATKGEKGMQGERGLPGKTSLTQLNPILVSLHIPTFKPVDILCFFTGTSSNLDLYAFKVRV